MVKRKKSKEEKENFVGDSSVSTNGSTAFSVNSGNNEIYTHDNPLYDGNDQEDPFDQDFEEAI